MIHPVLNSASLAIVIPAYNEALRIREVASAASSFTPHVIVIDDGSTDHTLDCIDDLPLHLVRHSHRLGKGAALRSGFARALELGVDAVITLDGDGQHDVADCPRLMAAFNNHPDSIIIGARLIDQANRPLIRRWANALGDWGVSWACGRSLIDSQSGLRLYPAALLSVAIKQVASQGFAYESDLLIQAIRQQQCNVVSIPISARYANNQLIHTYRKSHFRHIRDLALIIIHVSGHIIRQGQLIREYRRVRQNPVQVEQMTTPIARQPGSTTTENPAPSSCPDHHD